MKTFADNIATAKGGRGHPANRYKCDCRPLMGSVERCKLLAPLFKGWVPRGFAVAIRMRPRAAMTIVSAP
eukprot:10139312-Lingulodinium_polyedra.AAC.1